MHTKEKPLIVTHLGPLDLKIDNNFQLSSYGEGVITFSLSARPDQMKVTQDLTRNQFDIYSFLCIFLGGGGLY